MRARSERAGSSDLALTGLLDEATLNLSSKEDDNINMNDKKIKIWEVPEPWQSRILFLGPSFRFLGCFIIAIGISLIVIYPFLPHERLGEQGAFVMLIFSSSTFIVLGLIMIIYAYKMQKGKDEWCFLLPLNLELFDKLKNEVELKLRECNYRFKCKYLENEYIKRGYSFKISLDNLPEINILIVVRIGYQSITNEKSYLMRLEVDNIRIENIIQARIIQNMLSEILYSINYSIFQDIRKE